MTTYVSFRCGAMTLYLNADAVLAVTDSVDAAGERDMAEWEGQAIERLNLSRFLQQRGDGRQGLILTAQSTGAEPLMLGVDSIDNVLSLKASDFRPLPPLAGPLTDFFDAARPLADARSLGLRLRYPLPATLFGD